MPESLARLRSVLAQLPTENLPPRLLNVGCGAYPSARTLHGARPGWTLYGVDIDGSALRHAQSQTPSLRLIHADAIHLPAPLHAGFGLILVRHPDLFRHRAAWHRIMSALPDLLAPGGCLLITLYAPEETKLIRALTLPPPYPLDTRTLAPPDLAGHDRFVLAYRKIL